MDRRKTALYFALALVLFLLWQAWEQDYGQPITSTAAISATETQVAVKSSAASPETLPPPSAFSKANQPTKVMQGVDLAKQRLITVRTDVVEVKIDRRGGNIVGLNLLKYPVSYKTKHIPIQLLTNNLKKYYVAESGLASEQGPDTKNGQALYQSAQSSYSLTPGQNTLTVPLTWQRNGISVTKIFVLKRNHYQINVHYKIINRSNQNWIGHLYAQIRSVKPETEDSLLHFHTFTGAAISSPQKAYEKLSFKKLSEQDLSRNITGGWLAMQQQYFLSAWVPNQNQMNYYYSSVAPSQIYTIGFVGPPVTVSSGNSKTLTAKFYAGPEIKQRLEAVAKNLDLTIDFGFLWIIAIAILWLMERINLVLGNWGWSIIAVTFIIKLCFYHLSEKSYRSMARMRQLAPRLKQLKERYGNDKQKMTQATMELYKKEKVNPVGGCLPMLVQIPFFFALYYVLLEAVQLRQAPFIFWIHDLSQKDPYFILPILMGASMWMQQKLNPEPPDPTQAKMMMLLPIVFTVFFLYFPAGLVLYWLTNNLLSVAQQWWIMKKLERSNKAEKQKR